MKTLTNILCMLLLLVAISCKNRASENYPITHREDFTPQLIKDSLSEQISLDELPHSVKQGIYNDELFNGLNISNIVRIRDKYRTYYDMTFKDFDGQLIMVYYDEKGRIIIP